MFVDRDNLKEGAQLFEGTEGARRASGDPSNKNEGAAGSVSVPANRPDPEVLEKPTRRRFGAKYKLKILQEADRCSGSGEVGALLRREGLYYSNLAAWRKQRDKGSLKALGPVKRGRKAKTKNPLSGEVARLERENKKLQKRLKQAELIIDFQKKVAALLEEPLNQPPFEEDE